jgi:hypothetical protein
MRKLKTTALRKNKSRERKGNDGEGDEMNE